MHSEEALNKCYDDVLEYYGDIDVFIKNMHSEEE
jgi:hypothetical protein